MVLQGLHAPVQGWTTRAAMAANFINGCIVWTPACNCDNAAKYPNTVHLVRLATPIHGEAPGMYAERIANDIRAWLWHDCWRDKDHPMNPAYPVFIVGNEPNVPGVDVQAGYEWPIQEWLVQGPQYALALRNRFPGIVLASAALRPEDTHFVTPEYLAGFDVHAAHCYWQIEDDITNPNLGGAWRYVADRGNGQPLFITEVNSVAPDGSTERGTRPTEIIHWIATLDGRVEGFALFIADGAGDPDNFTDDPRTGWWQYDVSPDDARLVSTSSIPAQPEVKPDPLPPPTPPPPANDGDYRRFYPLDLNQFYAIMDEPDATLGGAVSPLRTEATYRTLIEATSDPARPVDPRLPLAFAWSEGHMMTDRGLAAAVVGNPWGVKFVDAPWTYDSGIPADTGGTYAGYANFGAAVRDWLRIMHNSIIGPDFEAGNLIGVVEHYTNGPGTGHNKADRYYRYVRDYPSSNGPGRFVVTREAVAREAESQIGQTWSVPYDAHNRPHWWCNPATGDFWCESLRERIGEHLGLAIQPYASAVIAGRAYQAAGKLRTDVPPPRGTMIFLDERFWPDGGHTGISASDEGTSMICTCTPDGIGVRPWGMQTPGYMGWADYDGVGQQPPEVDMRVDQHRNDPGTFARQWFGQNWQYAKNEPTEAAAAAWPYNQDFGIPGLWRSEFMAGRPLGCAISGEEPTEADGVVIQYFANGHIVWDNNTGTGYVN
jgi:hypothetical protein